MRSNPKEVYELYKSREEVIFPLNLDVKSITKKVNGTEKKRGRKGIHK